MKQIFLSFGYDTESPYGDAADTPAGQQKRAVQWDFDRTLAEFLDAEQVPRTYFLLGDYVYRCLQKEVRDSALPDCQERRTLRELYDPSNPLVEIQQHSFSHKIFRAKPGREKQMMIPEEFVKDVRRADDLIHRVFDVKTTGLRTPIGYSQDMTDQSCILEGLAESGFKYISSDLRDEGSYDASVKPERQPHTYAHIGFPQLVEMPSSGLQDSILTPDKARAANTKVLSAYELVEHYTAELHRRADAMQSDRPVSLALCLHPWAIMEYDPKLELHKRIIDYWRKSSAEIVPYGQVAARTLAV